MLVRYAYVVFLGILIATFIGVGISAFYASPKPPNNTSIPQKLMIEPRTSSTAAELDKREAENQSKFEQFDKNSKLYNRNVSLAALVSALIIVALGLTILSKLTIMSDGFVLGGVLTLVYSIVRGFGADDSMFRFFVVAVGLVVALVLGYLKFVRSLQKR